MKKIYVLLTSVLLTLISCGSPIAVQGGDLFPGLGITPTNTTKYLIGGMVGISDTPFPTAFAIALAAPANGQPSDDYFVSLSSTTLAWTGSYYANVVTPIPNAGTELSLNVAPKNGTPWTIKGTVPSAISGLSYLQHIAGSDVILDLATDPIDHTCDLEISWSTSIVSAPALVGVYWNSNPNNKVSANFSTGHLTISIGPGAPATDTLLIGAVNDYSNFSPADFVDSRSIFEISNTVSVPATIN